MNLNFQCLTRTIICLLLLFFLTNFKSVHCDKIVDKLLTSYAKEVGQNRGLILYGSGGELIDDVESISLRFASFSQLDVNEARILYIEVLEELLCRINQDHELPPFTFNNIKMSISFRNADGSDLDNGCVAYLFQGKNKLVYKGFDGTQPLGNEFYFLHKEPYEEARELVFANKKSIQKFEKN